MPAQPAPRWAGWATNQNISVGVRPIFFFEDVPLLIAHADHAGLRFRVHALDNWEQWLVNVDKCNTLGCPFQGILVEWEAMEARIGTIK